MRSHCNVKLLKPVLAMACSLDYAEAILRATSSEAYTYLKLAELLSKRNKRLNLKKKKLSQISTLPILLRLVALLTSNTNVQRTVQIG